MLSLLLLIGCNRDESSQPLALAGSPINAIDGYQIDYGSNEHRQNHEIYHHYFMLTDGQQVLDDITGCVNACFDCDIELYLEVYGAGDQLAAGEFAIVNECYSQTVDNHVFLDVIHHSSGNLYGCKSGTWPLAVPRPTTHLYLTASYMTSATPIVMIWHAQGLKFPF